MGRILVVDDERSIRVTLKAILEADGHQVETTEDAESAMAILKARPVDVVLTDIILPKVSGVQLLQRIQETSPEVPVIMMTGEPTLETASEALRQGAVDYLQKPVGKTEIMKTVQNLLRVKQLKDEKKRLEEEKIQHLGHLEELVAERTKALTSSEAALRRQAEELSILNRLAREVGASLTVDETIQAGMWHILEAVSPDLALLFFRENSELVPKGLFPEGAKDRWKPEIAHHVGDCLCGLCISEDRAIYSGDIQSDRRCTLEECKKAGFRSFAALPLKSGAETLGVLGLASVRPRDFSKEGPFLEALANELAVGLTKSLLYEQLEQRAKEIQKSLTRIKEGEADRLQLQLQLQQSQKMEAIGTLAGGIAHDFNNILSAVIGYTELALAAVEGSDRIQLYLNEVLTASARAKELVQQILAFSRQGGEQTLKPIHLKPIAREALKLLRASLPSTIEIRQNIQVESAVLGDPTRIHQVLMNLCTNAAHAMRKKGGVLDVRLADVQLSEEETMMYPDLSPGSYLSLTVSDTGHGMSQHIMDRIFDPFFTTKKKGEGTGLGLSVVHGIVGNLNGVIKVRSVPGKGTTFEVFLPAITREEEAATIAEESKVTGNERVLFVDDEPMLVDVAKKMLQSLGYTVTTRTSPMDALELFRSRPQDFDVVVTDLTMPQMTGDRLAKAILDIRPSTPIILCTGFSASLDEKRAASAGVRLFLHKPILKQDIAKAIRDALNGS
jgi:signal transduction histidine kinase/DNA-binding response OmpR family regulator